MPYVKRKYPVRRRRAPVRRRAPPSRWTTYGKAATQLYNDVATLKNLINTEFKAIDTTVSSSSISTSATAWLLNGATKGDDLNTREGRQFRMKSIQYHIACTMNAAASHTSVRLVLVLDKQANAAAPAFSDIFSVASTRGLRDLDGRKRFWIIKDQTIDLSITGQQERNLKFYRQFDIKTIFNSGNAGTIADIDTNSLYLFIISDEATNQASVSGFARLRYIDN